MADLDTPQTPQEVARLADVVIISVPIPQVKQVVAGRGPPSPSRRRAHGLHLREAGAP